MLKNYKSIALSLMLASSLIYSCNGQTINFPIPSTSNTPSSSVSPSSQNSINTNKYTIALKMLSDTECGGPKNKVMYEVTSKGTFSYNTQNADVISDKREERELNESEKSDLLRLLTGLDMAKLAKDDKKLPLDSPETKECRTIETFILNTNGLETSFDLNARLITHSNEYKEGLNTLKILLAKFSKGEQKPSDNSHVVTKNTYALPLKVTSEGECNMGTKTLFEVKEEGTFNYSTIENQNMADEKTIEKSRKLSDSEVEKLKNLLIKLDLLSLSEKDTKVPEGSPQTEECRSVKVFSLLVNKTSKTFDMNGRKLVHTDDYRKALTELDDFLISLQNPTTPSPSATPSPSTTTSPSPSPSTSSSPTPSVSPSVAPITSDYEFPLRLTLDGECKLGSKTKYEIDSKGMFTYSLDDELANPVKNASKLLSEFELNQVKELLTSLDLAKLAEQDTKVDSGTPATADCKIIKNFRVSFKSVDRIFDFNSRTVTHSDDYNRAVSSLERTLETLKFTSNINETEVKTNLDTSFALKFNQKGIIESDSLVLTFNKVLEDSRCPSDVVCIQAGTVKVNINVKKSNLDLGTVTLTLGTDATKKVGAYTVSLEAVRPQRISTKNQPSEVDYSLTLKVVKS